jgi:ATP-binding cassette subfamily B protein/ATP-binding cassette subfamily C protein
MIQIPNLNILKPIISKLLKLLTRKHKIYIILLLVLTIGFSLVETIGISAIMPFISIVSEPELLESGWYKKAYDFIGLAGAESFIIAMGIGIICFYIFRAVYSVFLTWITSKYSIGMYRYFSKKVFKIYLSVSYKIYTQKNSAVLMQSINSETNEVGKIVLNLLHFFAEIFTILMIYTLIVFINWKMTVVVTGILLVIVILLVTVLTKISKIQGEIRLLAGRKMNRTLKETLGNIKFIKLKGNEENILRTYDAAIEERTRSDVINSVLGIIPKSILESIGFSFLIGVVVFIVWFYRDASKVIPIISMYALALYRILPSVNRMLSNINNIAYSEKTFESVYDSLNQPIEEEGSAPLDFNSVIRLDNINFKYMTGGDVINNISLEIKKGDKIAFTGESGGGKSTLIDIIIGIHKPDSGKLFVDETLITDENIRSWRKKIGYIPQSIYLFDGTVAENVTFGSEPDEEKIITALKKANIWDFLSQKEGINTFVGDKGIQLSGGQQQRIGIARAIYDNPEILVLDEATSALDNETERKIMDEIYSVSENKTLIVIAHRLTTVERCDRKIRIENGRIV